VPLTSTSSESFSVITSASAAAAAAAAAAAIVGEVDADAHADIDLDTGEGRDEVCIDDEWSRNVVKQHPAVSPSFCWVWLWLMSWTSSLSSLPTSSSSSSSSSLPFSSLWHPCTLSLVANSFFVREVTAVNGVGLLLSDLLVLVSISNLWKSLGWWLNATSMSLSSTPSSSSAPSCCFSSCRDVVVALVFNCQLSWG